MNFSVLRLQNHNAVLAVRACLDALPDHTSVLLFDTMFHQTLPEEIYTYAIPPTEEQTPVPLRKVRSRPDRLVCDGMD